jgi:hypothetical protein
LAIVLDALKEHPYSEMYNFGTILWFGLGIDYGTALSTMFRYQKFHISKHYRPD